MNVALPVIKSTTRDNDFNTDTKIRRNTMDKCPLCFMIFTPRMEYMDRERHVDEHFA